MSCVSARAGKRLERPCETQSEHSCGRACITMKGRKPSARKIARRVLLFVLPSFIIGYALVSASDSTGGVGNSRRGMHSKSLPPPPPPRYEIRKHATEYSPDGGSREYGNLHDLDCGEQGALTEFKFNYDDPAKMVNNDYTCLLVVHGETFGRRSPMETPIGPSGSRWSSRNSMQQIASHDVDCGQRFISQWKMKQWSSSMTIRHQCTGTKTPSPQDCESSKSAPAGHSDHASAFADVKVRCAADSALTQFQYNGDVFEYTCCPKPQL